LYQRGRKWRSFELSETKEEGREVSTVQHETRREQKIRGKSKMCSCSEGKRKRFLRTTLLNSRVGFLSLESRGNKKRKEI